MQKVQSSTAAVSSKRDISTQFAIISLDLITKKEELLQVPAFIDGKPVTEEMVRRQVAVLNNACSCCGLTGRKKGFKAKTAFRLKVLQ